MDALQELAGLRQWMLWRYEGGTKVPYTTGGLAGKSNDSACWSTYQQCLDSHAMRSGVAFVFSEDDPYCGIDLDDCIVDGKYEDWAIEIIERFRGVAYCEISPSGTGVKLTTRAKKPAGSRCQSGNLECYDKLRFWAWTNNCVGDGFREIGDGQSAVDWLIENKLKASERATGSRRLRGSSVPASPELMARAMDYADNADGAGEGGRNNAGFRLAGHLHAFVDEYGSRLSDVDVYECLKRWNLRNSPPLEDDELRNLVVSARKHGTPPADKPPQIRVTPSEVNLDDFYKSFEPDESELEVGKSSVEDPGEFPSDCLLPPGFIADVASYTLATSDEPQPILALGGALCLLSVLTGRKIRNERNNRTNLFVLGLGPSGCGKDRPRTVNVDILAQICHSELFAGNSVGSGHGIESQLRLHPAKLFQLDEIGDLLKAIKKERSSGHMEVILQKIKMLSTSAHQIYTNSATADVKSFFTIDQPHLVIFGTATAEKFWDNLSVDAIEDGFLGRILPLEVSGYGVTADPVFSPVPQHILDTAKAWAEFTPGSGNLSSLSPTPAVFELSEDAACRHRKYCQDIDSKIPRDGSHKPTDGLWKRARGRAASLALLFAASRTGPTEAGVIELQDVQLAIKVINWVTRRTIYKVITQVSENQFQRDCNRVLEIIRKSQCDRTQLTGRTRWLKARDRMEIISHLQERGDIEIAEIKTRTNSKMVFRSVGSVA